MPTDKELIRMTGDYITPIMAALGIPIVFQNKYQQAASGIEVDDSDGQGAQAFIYKISDKRYGTMIIEYEDSGNNDLNGTYLQPMETTFQISTLVRQSQSAIPSALSASDVLWEISQQLQTEQAVVNFNDNYGVGILRVMDLPSSFFLDDKSQYEQQPNMSITYLHGRASTASVPIIADAIGQINAV